MHPKFNPAKILRTTEDQDLGQVLQEFAPEFAVLGYLDIARELISLVNTHPPLYRRESTHIFQPLWLIWDITGTWPEGEKAYVQQSADSGDQEGNERKREVVAELADQYETSNWTSAGFKKKEEQVYDETRLRGCVEKLREFTGKSNEWAADVTTGWMAMDKGSILLKALDIAIVLKEQGNFPCWRGLVGC